MNHPGKNPAWLFYKKPGSQSKTGVFLCFSRSKPQPNQEAFQHQGKKDGIFGSSEIQIRILSTIQNPMLKTTDFHGSNYHNAKGIQKKIWKYFFDRLIDGQKYVFLHTTRQRINLGHNEISLHSVPYCTDGLSTNFCFTLERKG